MSSLRACLACRRARRKTRCHQVEHAPLVALPASLAALLPVGLTLHVAWNMHGAWRPHPSSTALQQRACRIGFPSPGSVSVLKATLSNLLGGMGFYYGQSTVKYTSSHGTEKEGQLTVGQVGGEGHGHVCAEGHGAGRLAEAQPRSH